MRRTPTLALAIAGFIGCTAAPAVADGSDSGSSGSAGGAAQTIAEIVSASGGEFDNNRRDFDILLTAVIAADLVAPLSDPTQNLTVFTPNDGAFIALAKDLGYTGNDEAGTHWDFLVVALGTLGDPIEVLTDVLLYHVAPQRIGVLDFIVLSFFRETVDTLLPGATFQPFFFSIIDNDPDLRNAGLRFPLNVQASNGIIHTISRVLIPLDI